MSGLRKLLEHEEGKDWTARYLDKEAANPGKWICQRCGDIVERKDFKDHTEGHR